jgi:hypothetical protein
MHAQSDSIMSLRNEIFQTIPFDASSDANEPLIAVGDPEEEDHRLQEKALSRFKFCSPLLGLLVGFFAYSSAMGGTYLVITMWGEDVATKSKTDTFVVSLLCSFLFLAIVFVILGFLRNLVAITYSAIRGYSKDLPEEMVLHMEYRFVMGSLVGISLFWTMAAVLWGTTAQTVYCQAVLVVAFFWCKIMMMYFATNTNPSSSRQSMMAV